VLGYDGYEVANLFTERTPTVVELNRVTTHAGAWPELQQRLAEQLNSADGVLAAWGVAGASGALRRNRSARAAWLMREAQCAGHERIWMVGGEPRHPSRWHQYVADKHHRTSGGTFEERLAQVLTSTPIERARLST
jgi:hypothetical protein